MKDLSHGVDYLVDFYAVLNVPRDATPDAIKAGYREQTRKYHPDNYERVAPEFKSQAQRRMNVINDAKSILLSPSKRKSFDDQLARWRGPISTDGTPIRSISNSGWDVSRLLGTSVEAAPNSSRELEAAAQMIGWNQTIHNVLQQQFDATSDPSSDLIAAYDASLLQRTQLLQLKQAMQEERLGISNEIPSYIGSDKMSLDQVRLEQRREAVSREVTELMTAITRGEIKIIGPASQPMLDQVAANPAAAISNYRQLALQSFDFQAETLLKIAGEQAEIVRKRLSLIRIQYIPSPQPLFDKVALCISNGDKTLWQAWRLKNNQIDPDSGISKAALTKLVDESAAQRMVQSGRNVIFVNRPEGLSPENVLVEALNLHFMKYLDK